MQDNLEGTLRPGHVSGDTDTLTAKALKELGHAQVCVLDCKLYSRSGERSEYRWDMRRHAS